MQVWIDVRENKQWQNFHFGVNGSFKLSVSVVCNMKIVLFQKDDLENIHYIYNTIQLL